MIFAETYSKPELNPYLEIKLGDFRILGRSLAGIETVLAVPDWNVTFDTGRAPDFAFPLDCLALSHWHLDHAGGLSFYLGLRRLNSLPPLKIVVPKEKFSQAVEYLNQLKKVSDTGVSWELIASDTPVVLRRDLTLKAIPTFHGIPATGYLVEQTRKHLKAEFKGRTESEIVTAKARGIEVEERFIEPLFAFSGDTMGEFLETDARKAQYLAMECSFFGDEITRDSIRQYGHTHISDWRHNAEKIESRAVLMIHTSQRFTRKDIERSCRENLPKNLLDRLIIFR